MFVSKNINQRQPTQGENDFNKKLGIFFFFFLKEWTRNMNYTGKGKIQQKKKKGQTTLSL